MSRICHFTVADDKVLKEVRKLIKDMTFEDVHSAGKNGSYLFRWVLKVCNTNDSVSDQPLRTSDSGLPHVSSLSHNIV